MTCIDVRTWAAKDAYQLAGRTSVVRDGDYIAKGALIRFTNLIEDIDNVVGSTSAREDDDAAASGCC